MFMAQQPRTPLAGISSSQLSASHGMSASAQRASSLTTTPASAGSSNSTFFMPVSGGRRRGASADGYSPKVSRTTGQRPACLVNASLTYCGDNQIYAFGGFDQYTDEGVIQMRYLSCFPSRLTLIQSTTTS